MTLRHIFVSVTWQRELLVSHLGIQISSFTFYGMTSCVFRALQYNDHTTSPPAEDHYYYYCAENLRRGRMGKVMPFLVILPEL